MPEAERLSVILLSASFERVHYGLAMASAAAALARPVTLFVTLGATRAFLAPGPDGRPGWAALPPAPDSAPGHAGGAALNSHERAGGAATDPNERADGAALDSHERADGAALDSHERADGAALDARHRAQGVAGFEELLQACASLGVEIIVCEMGLRAQGLAAAALRPDLPLQRAGLATLLARGGQLVVL